MMISPLDMLFPGDRRHEPRLPDELFAIIVRFYWGCDP